MGTWGPGVFENDHARDLCSIEIDRLARQIEATLSLEPIAFDDIEGPLLYVRMLSGLTEAWESKAFTRDTVERWKKKYLDVFDSTITGAKEDYLAARREIIAREFDSLAAKLPTPLEDPKPPAKKRKKTTAR